MTSGQGESFNQALAKAREAERAGDFEAAVLAYRQALTDRPTHVASRVALGRALLAQGDPGGAREELFTALQHDPDQMVARRLLADASVALGDDLEAHRWLVEYLRVVKDDPDARRLLAQIEPRLRSDAPLRSRTLARMYLEQGHAEAALAVLSGLRDAGHDDEELRRLIARAATNPRNQKPERLLVVLRSWESRLKV